MCVGTSLSHTHTHTHTHRHTHTDTHARTHVHAHGRSHTRAAQRETELKLNFKETEAKGDTVNIKRRKVNSISKGEKGSYMAK